MNAMVIPDADEVLFGALCMEALDVMADPVDECLVGRHGDSAVYKIKVLNSAFHSVAYIIEPAHFIGNSPIRCAKAERECS
jgi:hypothetical protein